MEYAELRHRMVEVLEAYQKQSYDPNSSKIHNALAFLKGHHEKGYERYLAFREITTTSPFGDYQALRHNLAMAFVNCFVQDRASSKGSRLLNNIGSILKAAYKISDTEIDHHSPHIPAGDGGYYLDVRVGLAQVIEQRLLGEANAGQAVRMGPN
ncbi:MAG: hypothetical protein K0Q57_1118 [Gammaproteobacteria bacterium]|nr:hypothetical protein [Gammaproteobacteria bacterium]